MQTATSRFLLLFFCFFISAWAYADMQKFEYKNETLSVPIPNDWILGYQAQNENEIIREFVPKGQTVEKWTDMITIQIFTQLAKASPAEFIKRVAQESQKVCSDFNGKMYSGSDANHAMSLQSCTKYSKTGLGEITLLLAIRGKKALYLVQRAWRGPEFKLDKSPLTDKQRAEWVKQMQMVKLN